VRQNPSARCWPDPRPEPGVRDQVHNYTALTKSGREISGSYASETPNSITLPKRRRNRRNDPAQRHQELTSSRLSLMPEGFENTLNRRHGESDCLHQKSMSDRTVIQKRSDGVSECWSNRVMEYRSDGATSFHFSNIPTLRAFFILCCLPEPREWQISSRYAPIQDKHASMFAILAFRRQQRMKNARSVGMLEKWKLVAPSLRYSITLLLQHSDTPSLRF